MQNLKSLEYLRIEPRMVRCLQYLARVHSKSTFCERSRVRGKGLTRLRKQSVPPASEREARMDDEIRAAKIPLNMQEIFRKPCRINRGLGRARTSEGDEVRAKLTQKLTHAIVAR
jgi:hypothetical protein